MTSPDYKKDSNNYCSGVVSGKEIEISITKTDQTNKSYLDDVIKASGKTPNETFHNIIKYAKPTIIGGQRAVQYLESSGAPGEEECGSVASTVTIKDNYKVSVVSLQDKNVTTYPYLYEPYATVYKNIISSIKFQ